MYLKQLEVSIRTLFVITLLTGVIYPLGVSAIARFAFPHQANGSLILRNEKVVGSELIGQPFTDSQYFWSRLSATGPTPYNGAASSGSNLGPLNPALIQSVEARIAALRQADPQNTQKIPVDLVTASASGLDPHISPAAALYQVARVARARAVPEEEIRTLVKKYTEDRWLGVLGEKRVNVVLLNLALDENYESTQSR